MYAYSISTVIHLLPSFTALLISLACFASAAVISDDDGIPTFIVGSGIDFRNSPASQTVEVGEPFRLLADTPIETSCSWVIPEGPSVVILDPEADDGLEKELDERSLTYCYYTQV